MPAAQRVGCGVPFDEIEGAVAVGVAQLVGDADRAAAAAAEVLFKEALVAFQLGIALDGAVGADGRGALARTVRTEIAVGGDGAAAHVDGDGVEVELGAEEQLLDLAVDDEDGRGVIGDLPLGKGKALPVEGTDLEGDGAVRLGAERQRRHGRGRRRGRILGVVFADVGEGARFPPVDKDGEVAVADGVCGFGEGDLNIACRYGDARAFAVDGNADIAVGCGGEHDLVGRFALFAHAHLLAFDGDGKAVIPRSGEREPEGEILRPVAAADARRAVERVPFERHVLAQRDAVALADGIGEIVAVVVQSALPTVVKTLLLSTVSSACAIPKEMHIAAMQNKNAASNVIRLTFCLLISVNTISFHNYARMLPCRAPRRAAVPAHPAKAGTKCPRKPFGPPRKTCTCLFYLICVLLSNAFFRFR